MRFREYDVLDSRGIVVGSSWLEPDLDILGTMPAKEIVAGGWTPAEARAILGVTPLLHP